MPEVRGTEWIETARENTRPYLTRNLLLNNEKRNTSTISEATTDGVKKGEAEECEPRPFGAFPKERGEGRSVFAK